MAKVRKLADAQRMKADIEKYLVEFGIDLNETAQLLSETIDTQREVNELSKSTIGKEEYFRKEKKLMNLELLMYLIRK